MTGIERLLADLAAGALGRADPPQAAAIRRLRIRHGAAPTSPVPALFEPVVHVVLQGAKRLTIDGRILDFTAGTCAVSAVGLPFVSQVIKASPDRPYLGVELRLDPGLVAAMLLDMPPGADREQPARLWALHPTPGGATAARLGRQRRDRGRLRGRLCERAAVQPRTQTPVRRAADP